MPNSQYKAFFQQYLLKSWLLAVVITVIFLHFLNFNALHKYHADIVNVKMVDGAMREQGRSFVRDLNDDGKSEFIITFDNSKQNPLQAIQIWGLDGGIYYQENIPGNFVDHVRVPGVIDIDHDQFSEIVLFTIIDDSLVLNLFEPFDSLNNINRVKYIAKLPTKYAPPDIYVREITQVDFTNDGNDDILFIVAAGWSLLPRKIFCYDVANDSVFSSPEFGESIENMSVVDLNGDGRLDIVGGTGPAAGNVEDTLGIPYHDYNAYIMAFDHNLQLLFEPLVFEGFRSYTESYVISYEGKPMIVALMNHTGCKNYIPEILKIDSNGQVIDKYEFLERPKCEAGFYTRVVNGKSQFIVLWSNGSIDVFSSSLEKLQTVNLEHNQVTENHMFLLNGSINNLQGEVIRAYESGANAKFLFLDDRFKPTAELIVDKNYDVGHMSVVQYNGQDYLVVPDRNKYALIDYSRNPLYPLRLLIYLGIFLGIYLFIWVIRKLQLIQLQRQDQVRNQIANLQLKNINNQMNPHFTFNVFNAISAIILKESESAYKPFLQFSTLIRNTLESSDQIARSIQEETEYLKAYLELEKLRFPGLFDYTLSVQDEVDQQMRIPKMLLQTYVENAIKHGLRPKGENGHLTIKFELNGKYLKISVEDNGVGRKKAKELKTGTTGFGLRIMEQYFELFNEFNDSKITHQIIDLHYIDAHATGTKVEILVPLNFSYKLKKHGRSATHRHTH